MAVLFIVQPAGQVNNFPEPNQYTEIEYLGQYSVCKFFPIKQLLRAAIQVSNLDEFRRKLDSTE